MVRTQRARTLPNSTWTCIQKLLLYPYHPHHTSKWLSAKRHLTLMLKGYRTVRLGCEIHCTSQSFTHQVGPAILWSIYGLNFLYACIMNSKSSIVTSCGALIPVYCAMCSLLTQIVAWIQFEVESNRNALFSVRFASAMTYVFQIKAWRQRQWFNLYWLLCSYVKNSRTRRRMVMVLLNCQVCLKVTVFKSMPHFP